MTPAAGRSTPVVRIRRLLPASPEQVFQAWTDEESLRQWMSPYGEARATIDLRVGGCFRIVMLGEGVELEHTGEYREIVPPRRLVFTWRSEFTDRQATVVTVVLRPEGDQTELVLTHELLPDEEAGPHEFGWGKIVDNLQAHLEAQRT